MFGFEHHRGAEQRLTPHYNPGIEICYCKSGVYRWNVEGELAEIRPGELSVTRPRQIHSGHNNVLGPGRLYWLIVATDGEFPDENRTASGRSKPNAGELKESFLRPLLASDTDEIVAAFAKTSHCSLGHVPRAPELITTIHSELASQALGRRTVVRSALAELLVTTARRLRELEALGAKQATSRTGLPGDNRGPSVPADGPHSRASQTDGRIPEPVLEVLTAVSQDPAADWTAEDMADRAEMGRTAFTEWCRRVTGRSPRWYVLEQRLEKGRDLLEDQRRPVTDVAFETGFSSSQHFSSAFRKLYGESPSEYRRRAGGS